jgi:hypothetical protein
MATDLSKEDVAVACSIPSYKQILARDIILSFPLAYLVDE